MATIKFSIAGDGELSASPNPVHAKIGEEVVFLAPGQQPLKVEFERPKDWDEGSDVFSKAEAAGQAARAHLTDKAQPGKMSVCTTSLGGKRLKTGVIVDPR